MLPHHVFLVVVTRFLVTARGLLFLLHPVPLLVRVDCFVLLFKALVGSRPTEVRLIAEGPVLAAQRALEVVLRGHRRKRNNRRLAPHGRVVRRLVRDDALLGFVLLDELRVGESAVGVAHICVLPHGHRRGGLALVAVAVLLDCEQRQGRCARAVSALP